MDAVARAVQGRRKMKKKKVIDIIEYKPHAVSELICLACQERWIGVYPANALLKDMVCKCGVKGLIIKTGQPLEDEE